MAFKDIQKRRDYNKNYRKIRLQNPEYREKKNAQARIRLQNPAVKAAKAAYQRTDKAKARLKNTPGLLLPSLALDPMVMTSTSWDLTPFLGATKLGAPLTQTIGPSKCLTVSLTSTK